MVSDSDLVAQDSATAETEPLFSAARLVQLRKGCERRVLQGHAWVFSNEIAPGTANPPGLVPGEPVRLVDYRGKFLAVAYYNPHSLIAARIIGRNDSAAVSVAWMRGRLQEALQYRDSLYNRPYYRWVYGESDQLPGLIIDRFNDRLSIQILTAGMYQLLPLLRAALKTFDFVRGYVIDFEGTYREQEHLPTTGAELWGDSSGPTTVFEGDAHFETQLVDNQKTGWYFDQRDNRQQLQRLQSLGNVLDLFCFAGAWGIQAMRSGANSALCVDRSESALAQAQRNASLNQVAIDTQQADVTPFLKSLIGTRTFDTVILDPPALIKKKKDFEAGLQSYYQLNRLAAKLVAPGGWLISCSCSYHLPTTELLTILQHAGRSAGRHVRIAEIRGQSADHPVHPAIPETNYLKVIMTQLNND